MALTGNVTLEPPRSSYIGSSEIATIFGLNPFETVGDLWLRKTGRRKESGESNADQLRGIHLEPVVREKVLPTREGVLSVEDDPNFYLHRESNVGCHPDGRIHVAEKGRGALEIKCPNIHSFSSYRENGLPGSMVSQLLVTAALTGQQRGFFAVHNADSWATLLFDVEIDPANERVVNELLARSLEWWEKYVDGDRQPEEFDFMPAPELPQLRGDLVYRDDDAWLDLMDEYGDFREAKALVDDVWKGSEEEPGLKDRIIEAMGEEAKIQGGGWKMQRIQQTRRSFSRKHLEALGPLDPDIVEAIVREEYGEVLAQRLRTEARLDVNDDRLYTVSRFETLRGDETPEE